MMAALEKALVKSADLHVECWPNDLSVLQQLGHDLSHGVYPNGEADAGRRPRSGIYRGVDADHAAGRVQQWTPRVAYLRPTAIFSRLILTLLVMFLCRVARCAFPFSFFVCFLVLAFHE